MISFQSQTIAFKPKDVRKTKKWLSELVSREGFELAALNYIFMTDDELLEMNKSYLNHDTYTDIITFDTSDVEEEIEGDIFISIDRVKENAKTFSVDFDTELRRVLAHGALHLCGYPDKKPEEAKKMRAKEDEYLELYKAV